MALARSHFSTYLQMNISRYLYNLFFLEPEESYHEESMLHVLKSYYFIANLLMLMFAVHSPQCPRIGFALGCRVENSGTKLVKRVENSTPNVV